MTGKDLNLFNSCFKLDVGDQLVYYEVSLHASNKPHSFFSGRCSDVVGGRTPTTAVPSSASRIKWMEGFCGFFGLCAEVQICSYTDKFQTKIQTILYVCLDRFNLRIPCFFGHAGLGQRMDLSFFRCQSADGSILVK